MAKPTKEEVLKAVLRVVQEEDELVSVLYARALQRRGAGFPSTEEEIRDFEAGLHPSDEERKRISVIIDRALDEGVPRD